MNSNGPLHQVHECNRWGTFDVSWSDGFDIVCLQEFINGIAEICTLSLSELSLVEYPFWEVCIQWYVNMVLWLAKHSKHKINDNFLIFAKPGKTFWLLTAETQFLKNGTKTLPMFLASLQDKNTVFFHTVYKKDIQYFEMRHALCSFGKHGTGSYILFKQNPFVGWVVHLMSTDCVIDRFCNLWIVLLVTNCSI